jgi:CubicO group peptidase (beta-lactamase class C family)
MNHHASLSITIVAGVCLLFTSILSAASPATDPASLHARLPAAIQPFVDRHEVAGAVTLVANRAGVIDVEAFGQADIAASTPMKPDAIFWIASMTKPVTASAILMLQDQGKLNVDDPIAKYLPELAQIKTKDGTLANLTIRHLITHTSGMEEATPEEAASSKTLPELIPHYADKPVDFPPGSKWSYCQSGINTLGRIIEVVSGQSYPEFVQANFFDPLQMKDTTFYPTDEQAKRIVTSYERKADGTLVTAKVPILHGREVISHDRYPAPNGGLFSTAGDYAQFARMLLNSGTLDGHRYLSPEAVKQMTSIQTGDLQTGFTPGNGWGLGVCVIRQPQGITSPLSPGTFGHGGAFGTQVWIDPTKDQIDLLMIQRSNLPNSDASDIRQAFQDAAAPVSR